MDLEKADPYELMIGTVYTQVVLENIESQGENHECDF